MHQGPLQVRKKPGLWSEMMNQKSGNSSNQNHNSKQDEQTQQKGCGAFPEILALSKQY